MAAGEIGERDHPLPGLVHGKLGTGERFLRLDRAAEHHDAGDLGAVVAEGRKALLERLDNEGRERREPGREDAERAEEREPEAHPAKPREHQDDAEPAERRQQVRGRGEKPQHLRHVIEHARRGQRCSCGRRSAGRSCRRSIRSISIVRSATSRSSHPACTAAARAAGWISAAKAHFCAA